MDDKTGSVVASRVMEIALKLDAAVDLADLSRSAERDFDLWSQGYDAKIVPGIYLSPARLTVLVTKHVAQFAGPILDLACGTGLMGEELRALGFTDIIGVDLSGRMLERAAAKAVYSRLVKADMHGTLPLNPGSFAAVVCMGAFYEGIADVQALAHVLPLIRPGGHLICDIEMVAWEAGGFGAALRVLAAEGLLDLLHAMPGRFFAPGHTGADDDGVSPQGVFVVARVT